MQHPKYEDIIVFDEFKQYFFTSVGPNGNISKVVQFSQIEDTDIFNLAFGNKLEDGSLDDLAKNDNKDRNKILATVVFTISFFLDEYPEKIIYFSGSTPERTRLYRMAITINLEELLLDFEIFGIFQQLESFISVPFEKGVDYFGFLIKKK